MKPVKTYTLPEGEFHMLGDSVCVRWNVKRVSKTIKGADGLTYSATDYERVQPPFIAFAWIRERNGEIWLDEDSPVSGGLYLKEAENINSELSDAITYLREMGAQA